MKPNLNSTEPLEYLLSADGSSLITSETLDARQKKISDMITQISKLEIDISSIQEDIKTIEKLIQSCKITTVGAGKGATNEPVIMYYCTGNGMYVNKSQHDGFLVSIEQKKSIIKDKSATIRSLNNLLPKLESEYNNLLAMYQKQQEEISTKTAEASASAIEMQKQADISAAERSAQVAAEKTLQAEKTKRYLIFAGVGVALIVGGYFLFRHSKI